MSLPKVMIVYGTRPEAIKVATVIERFEQDRRFQAVSVTTGQHREMLDQVNKMFGIVPKHDLHLMQHGQSLNGIVARALAGLDAVIQDEAPDAVLVQGDTSTAMAAAIAAFNRRVPVVHLEAGLRTGRIDSPFPEEANRKLISQVASLHLAPTAASRTNLLQEGFDPDSVVITGNTVIDALLEASTWNTVPSDPAIAKAVASGRPIVLATTHRRESLGDGMDSIGRALAQLASMYPDHVFILPLHRNPSVRDAVLPHLAKAENFILTEPLPYAEFTTIMAAARLILTDSGGIQEEAPSLGKPVLVLRDNTERPEAVDAGTVRLVGTNFDRIVFEADHLLSDRAAYARMAGAVNPYGDGAASDRTVAAVAELLEIGLRLPDFSPRVADDALSPAVTAASVASEHST